MARSDYPRLNKARVDVMNAGRRAQWGRTEELTAARAELATEKIAAFIEKALASAPPLSEAQVDRIVGQLRPAGES